MTPDKTPERIAGEDDIPEDITEDEVAARDQTTQAEEAGEPEWSGVGEKPLKEHVRNETTVDLEEGSPVGITLGDPVEDWAGSYPARPDHEAMDPNQTPPYDVASAGRQRFLANGPGRDEPTFDVHDYVEGDNLPEGVNLSGHIVPNYG